ncbi:hypothetical protein [Terricaulis sp.]|uniref:hypothetical protein n=1 Tax=Terricaulis sp. TaxID=2768686 RepID=UPI0037843357
MAGTKKRSRGIAVIALVLALAGAPLLLARAAQAQDMDDPLAPARQGYVRCDEPDTVRRTCIFMETFRFERGGRITSHQTTLHRAEPLVVMEIETPITMRGAAFCDPFRESDVNAATFSVDGRAAGRDATASLRAEVLARFSALMGRESCVLLAPAGEGRFTTSVTIDGAPYPRQASTMIWVRPEDGYRVLPPSAAADV